MASPRIEKLSGFQNIYKGSTFDEDFSRIFGRSARQRDKQLEWLYTKLKILDSLGYQALLQENFKALKGTSDPKIYEIRHPRSKFNERVLYIYCDGTTVLLLTAFLEKSSSDFNAAIARAQNIVNTLE